MATGDETPGRSVSPNGKAKSRSKTKTKPKATHAKVTATATKKKRKSKGVTKVVSKSTGVDPTPKPSKKKRKRSTSASNASSSLQKQKPAKKKVKVYLPATHTHTHTLQLTLYQTAARVHDNAESEDQGQVSDDGIMWTKPTGQARGPPVATNLLPDEPSSAEDDMSLDDLYVLYHTATHHLLTMLVNPPVPLPALTRRVAMKWMTLQSL